MRSPKRNGAVSGLGFLIETVAVSPSNSESCASTLKSDVFDAGEISAVGSGPEIEPNDGSMRDGEAFGDAYEDGIDASGVEEKYGSLP